MIGKESNFYVSYIGLRVRQTNGTIRLKNKTIRCVYAGIGVVWFMLLPSLF